MFALPVPRASSPRPSSQLRRGRSPGSCARASWIDSGYGSDQAHFEKRETPDWSVLDLPFSGHRIHEVSDQKKSIMPSLQ